MQVHKHAAGTKTFCEPGKQTPLEKVNTKNQVPRTRRQRFGLKIDTLGAYVEAGGLGPLSGQRQSDAGDVGDRDVQATLSQPDRVTSSATRDVQRLTFGRQQRSQSGDEFAGFRRRRFRVAVPSVPFFSLFRGHEE